MKLTLNMNANEGNATMSTITKAASDFGFEIAGDMHDACYDIREAAEKCTSQKFPGGRCAISVDDSDSRVYDISFEMEEDAYVEAMVIAAKVARYIAPVISAGKAMLSSIKGIGECFGDYYAGITATYNKKFVPAKKYAVATLFNEDLELACKVLVEDDGLDNIRMVSVANAGKEYGEDVIMNLFNSARERGEETKDSMTLRYPEIKFEYTSLDEAMKVLNDMKGVRADYNGMMLRKKKCSNCQGCTIADDD